MSDDVNATLRRGGIIRAGRGLYQRCAECGEIVQINKWVIGSLHLCDPPEETVNAGRRVPKHPR